MARFNQPTKQNITKFMKFFFTSLYPEFQAGAKAVLRCTVVEHPFAEPDQAVDMDM